jgi:hypothetical protein
MYLAQDAMLTAPSCLVQVSFQYSPGEDPNEKPTTSTLDMLAGSNLRKEMQRQGELVHCDSTTRGSALA